MQMWTTQKLKRLTFLLLQNVADKVVSGGTQMNLTA